MLPQEILDDISLVSCDLVVAHAVNSPHSLRRIISNTSSNLLDEKYTRVLMNPSYLATLIWLIKENVNLAPSITHRVLIYMLHPDNLQTLNAMESAPEHFFWCLASYNEELCFLLQKYKVPWLMEKLATQTRLFISSGWEKSVSMKSLMGIRLLCQMKDFDIQFARSMTPWGVKVCKSCFIHCKSNELNVAFTSCEACGLGEVVSELLGENFVQRYTQRYWSEYVSIWTERLFDQTFSRYFGLSRNSNSLREQLFTNASNVSYFTSNSEEYVLVAVPNGKKIAKKFEPFGEAIKTHVISNKGFDTDAFNINVGGKLRLFEFNPLHDILLISTSQTVGSPFYEWLLNAGDWFALDYSERLDTFKLTSYPCADNHVDSNFDVRKETWLPVNSIAYHLWALRNAKSTLLPPKWGDDNNSPEESLHVNPYNCQYSWYPTHVFR
jgi:hypothetical protein